MKNIVVLFLIAFTSTAFTQNTWWNREGNSSENERIEEKTKEVDSSEQVIREGRVTINKDPNIEKIIKFKSATIPPHSGVTQDGFRIQLFFDQNRSNVDKERGKLLASEPDFPTYVEYHAPNYLLLLGDFRTRLEAEKVRSQMAEEFPAAIIKESKIYLPKIKEFEEELIEPKE